MNAVRQGVGRLTAKSPNDIVLLSAIRSPITKGFKGGFKDAWPEDILRPVMREAAVRANIELKDVEDVLIGNVLAELGFAKTGRMALCDAGFPVTTTFHTVNRQCSSSLQALTHISHSILAGQIDVGLAGGVESMTRNYGSRGVPQDVSPSLRATTVKAAADCLLSMGITSENVAKRYNISRQDQDDYALLSHERALHAQQNGYFDSEIVPIDMSNPDGSGNSRVEQDDTIRPGVTAEKLAKLNLFLAKMDEVRQAIHGASATIVARRSWADSGGLKPIGRFVATQVAGCQPDEMGIGPAVAIPRLLKASGVSLEDVDIFEINEAFASQVVYCIRKLNLDVSKLNPNGGAIALGHPTGATGARQVASILAELKRRDKEVGVVSMCSSTGLGVASIILRE